MVTQSKNCQMGERGKLLIKVTPDFRSRPFKKNGKLILTKGEATMVFFSWQKNGQWTKTNCHEKNNWEERGISWIPGQKMWLGLILSERNSVLILVLQGKITVPTSWGGNHTPSAKRQKYLYWLCFTVFFGLKKVIG